MPTTETPYKSPPPRPPFLLRPAKKKENPNPPQRISLSHPTLPPVAMEMTNIACIVLVAAASAATALAAEAPAPGPASASFAITPSVGAAVGAAALSFFAFYLQ
ncbi:hypothetical protein OPV22_034197 [Ensete ventricosum]|uniref:Uncharacterized protein n=1 Tax=Ensete ventricosum TaxID=4639 RepID=A0AAV8P419_ENSVE|nr:hypothetical protein OPV22_034197 [Ensete ventricosum]RWW24898.1 hypothetical protein GW17_00010794 [Ensete ventricosum]RZR82319.1 hypothetical protein BHM03_00008705 [Ensete ventricosum]